MISPIVCQEAGFSLANLFIFSVCVSGFAPKSPSKMELSTTGTWKWSDFSDEDRESLL